MEAKDLMIGDWVYTKAKERNVKVRGVRVDTDNAVVLTDFGDVWWPTAEFEPIPLTEEILYKNGFEKINVNYPFRTSYRIDDGQEYLEVLLHAHNDDFRIEFNPSLSQKGITYYGRRMAYVHDLQHAMRMCGIEKEIIL